MYRLVTKTSRATKWGQESLMTYLGKGMSLGELQFNARPAAGTQTVDVRNIVSITHMPYVAGESRNREQTRHYVNRKVMLRRSN
jgi:hypothetical protein